MTTPSPHPPSTCPAAMAALEADPLQLPGEVEAHLRACPACAEARVLWLALADSPEVAVPAGYFEGLPFRIQRKLPSRRAGLHRPNRFLLAAAGLLLATGLGATGFFMGRAMRAPLVEAAQPKPLMDALEPSSETPFTESEDTLSQLTQLSPQEAEQTLARLQATKASRGK